MKAAHFIGALVLLFTLTGTALGMESSSDNGSSSSDIVSMRSRGLSLGQLECGEGHPIVIPELGEVVATLFLPGPNSKKVKKDLAILIDHRLKRKSKEIEVQRVLSQDTGLLEILRRQSTDHRTPSPSISDSELRDSGDSDALRELKEGLQDVVMESIEEYLDAQHKKNKKMSKDLTTNRLKFRLAILALAGTTITAIATSVSTVMVAAYT